MGLRERQRQELVICLTELLEKGHSLAQALRQLEPVSHVLRRQVSQLRARIEQGDTASEKIGSDEEQLSAPGLLPAELAVMLETSQLAEGLPRLMGHVKRYLIESYELVRLPLLNMVYSLALLHVLFFVCVISKRWFGVFVKDPYEGFWAVQWFGSAAFAGMLVGADLFLLYWGWWKRRLLARPTIVVRLVEGLLGAIPGLGGLFQQPALALSAASLSVTLRARVPLPLALTLAAGSCRSTRLARALEQASARVREGASLTRAIEHPSIPAALQVAASRAAEKDLPRALSIVAAAARGRARTTRRRLAKLSFSLSLIIAASCIGLVLCQLWDAVNGAAAIP